MNDSQPSRQQLDKVNAVKYKYQHELLAKENVVGVGVGYQQKDGQRTNQIALVVMVRKKVPGDQLTPEDIIPEEIEGVPVDVQQVGDIQAQ